MKASDYFPVVLFITFCKVLQTFGVYGTVHYGLLLQTFEFVEEILKCDHSNENNTFVWYCLLY